MQLILIICTFVLICLPAFGQSESNGDNEGAKGLYFEQLQKPSENINTGMRYWIELNRQGQTLRVTNKQQFLSDDKIRFHIQSNIDGYAYILLKNGSRGEQSVLFPDPNGSEDNHVEHDKDYVLPQDGFLTFDQYPGIEKVTLLLSRNTVNAEAYLSKPQDQPAVIASAQAGSKDLVPAKIVIAYNQSKVLANTVGNLTQEKSEPIIVHGKKIALNSPQKSHKNNNILIASNRTSRKHQPPHANPKPETEIAAVQQTHVVAPPTQSEDDGVVTVVYKDPSGVLYVDMLLEHK